MPSDSKNKNLHKTDWVGNIGCLLLILLFAAWGVVIYNGINRSINDKTFDLRAEARYNNGILTLTNKESVDWQYIWCSLDTDDNPETYEYSYYISEIKSRATIDIDLSLFTRNNIEYFDPTVMKPKNISLFGQTGLGTGHFVYKFN
jgi:hypothetical protein